MKTATNPRLPGSYLAGKDDRIKTYTNPTQARKAALKSGGTVVPGLGRGWLVKVEC